VAGFRNGDAVRSIQSSGMWHCVAVIVVPYFSKGRPEFVTKISSQKYFTTSTLTFLEIFHYSENTQKNTQNNFNKQW